MNIDNLCSCVTHQNPLRNKPSHSLFFAIDVMGTEELQQGFSVVNRFLKL